MVAGKQGCYANLVIIMIRGDSIIWDWLLPLTVDVITSGPEI